MNDHQILITETKVSLQQLKTLCDVGFGEMVKVVVDVKRQVVAIGGELHADAEKLLLENGSNQMDVWGANLYPELEPQSRIELMALSNIRPQQDNPSMEIQDDRIRTKVTEIIESLVLGPDEKLV